MHVNTTVSDLINPYRSLGASRGQGVSKSLPTGKPTGTGPQPSVREVSLADIRVQTPPPAEPQQQQQQQQQEEMLTLRGLREAWGQSDTPYDLNSDGTVNFADMLQLIKQLGESHHPVTPTDPAPPPSFASADPVTEQTSVAGGEEPEETPAPAVTLRSLLAAFGKRDSQHDLNNDGTVNFGDVIEFLARQRGAAPPESDTPHLAPVAPDLVAGTPQPRPVAPDSALSDHAAELTNDGPPPVTIEELREAFGKRNNERLDLNGDGVVNFGDFLKLIADRGEQAPSGAQQAGSGEIAERLAEQRAAFQRVEPIADSLVSQLRAKGFRTHPPANLHEVVAKFDLPSTDQKALLHQLNAKYPKGLGVNLRG
ncbi:MAG: hypothetical protein GY715_04660 [Planctomycetes bacterium]|nr:hypothetical protein [Planctomycetota bacterium]